MNLLAKELGAPPVTRHAPYKIAYGVAFILECIWHALRIKTPPMVTRYAVWLMGRRCFFSAEKARKELAGSPPFPTAKASRKPSLVTRAGKRITVHESQTRTMPIKGNAVPGTSRQRTRLSSLCSS